jgi:hypothetical protein
VKTAIRKVAIPFTEFHHFIMNLNSKTMKIKFLTLITFVFSGCAGVKFANAPVNKPLPETFTNRSLYPAGVAAYEFQDLVGNILRIKANQNPLRIGMIRPNNFVSVVIPITESNNYYKSRIQKGAESKGSYLAFAADFSEEQLAEIELIDIARAGIRFENDTIFDQITSRAQEWVRNNPKTDTSVTRVWIKSVVLTKTIYNEFTNVGIKASGQVGDVVGVTTGVYNKSAETIRSVLISFEAFDIDELVKNSINSTTNLKGMFPIAKEQIRTISIYPGTIKGKIQ